MPQKQKNRWRLAWDISGIIALLTLVVGFTAYLTRLSTRVDYVLEQVADFKAGMIMQANTIDGIKTQLNKQDIILAKTYYIVSGGKHIKLGDDHE